MNKVLNELNTSTLIKNIFKENWNETFIIDAIKDNNYSYEKIFSYIVSYKEIIEKKGVREKHIICLLMQNSFELLILYFACLLLKVVVVPIDPNKGENDIAEILSNVNYKLIITNLTDFNNDKALNINQITNNIDSSHTCNHNDLDLFNEVDYDSVYLISFTSGSTGQPKGVMHSFNNLVYTATAFNERFKFNQNNIFYHTLPMTYMAGILNSIIVPFLAESKIVLGERFGVTNVLRFWELPIKHSVNVFWFNPTMISLLLKLDRGKSGIEYSKNTKIIGCVATAPLDNQLKTNFEEKYDIKLYEGYGLSETLFVATNYPDKIHKGNSVCELLSGVEISFANDEELLINVPWMFKGYSNINTSKFFSAQYYTSGDLARIDNDGYLFITGRKKDLIIRGGINISPRRIEDFICTFKLFDEFTIIGLPDVILGEKIICFYLTNTEFTDINKKMLVREIINKLGKDYIIDEFVKLPEIPKNTNGKIDKLKIKESYKV